MPKADARSRTARTAAKAAGRNTAPGKSAAPRKAAKAGLGSGTRARPGVAGGKAGTRSARRLGGKPGSKPAVKTASKPIRKTKAKKVALVSGNRTATPKESHAISLVKAPQPIAAKHDKPTPTEPRATARGVVAAGTEGLPPAIPTAHPGKDANRPRVRSVGSTDLMRGDSGGMKVQEPAGVRGTSDLQHGGGPNGLPAGSGAGTGGQGDDSTARPGLPVPIASFTI